MGARSVDRRFQPDLVLAGVSRCGTTSLTTWLGTHPDIRPGAIKAHPYFRNRLFESDTGSLDTYLANFRGAPRRVTLDGHGGYCDLEPSVLPALRSTLPQARVLIVLREPVDRAVSFYRYIHSRFLLDDEVDFAAYVDSCLSSPRADRRTPDGTRQTGVSAGEYARWLAEWGAVWGDALRVVFFDDLRADPENLVRCLLEWLDLDPEKMPAWEPTAQNPSVGYRWAWLHRQAIRTNEGLEALFRRQPRLKRTLRKIYQGLNAGPAGRAIPRAATTRLARHYATANRNLPRILSDLGLTSWPDWAEAGASPALLQEPQEGGDPHHR